MGNVGNQLQNMLGSSMKIDTDAFAKAFQMNMTEDDLKELMTSMTMSATASYDNNLQKLGYVDFANPSQISIYPTDFESKEKVVKIHQEQGTLQAMLAVMVPQVLGQASVMEMQAAAFLAGFVVVDHTGHIQRHQHLFGQNLINLPILNVRRVYWSNLAPFFQGEMGGFAWLPRSI